MFVGKDNGFLVRQVRSRHVQVFVWPTFALMKLGEGQVRIAGFAGNERLQPPLKPLPPIPAVVPGQAVKPADKKPAAIVELLNFEVSQNSGHFGSGIAHRQQQSRNGPHRRTTHPLDVLQHTPFFQHTQRTSIGNTANTTALENQVSVRQRIGASRCAGTSYDGQEQWKHEFHSSE